MRSIWMWSCWEEKRDLVGSIGLLRTWVQKWLLEVFVAAYEPQFIGDKVQICS